MYPELPPNIHQPKLQVKGNSRKVIYYSFKVLTTVSNCKSIYQEKLIELASYHLSHPDCKIRR